MTRALRGALLGAIAFAPLALFADDQRRPGSMNKSEFMAVLTGQDSTKAAAVIKRLDPDNKNDHDLLMWVLEKGTWYFRSAASETLSKTKDPILLNDLTTHVFEKSERNALIREGVIAALSRTKETGWIADLGKELSDKDWKVRREIAYALRDSTNKSTVDALINRWQVETNPLVKNYIRRSLEDVTKYYLGQDPKRWADWWLKNRDTINLAAPDEADIKKEKEAADKAEKEGLKTVERKTETSEVEVVHDDIGIGVPIFILPEYGYSKDMMIPFFLEIERLGAMLKYVDLPPISKFPNLKGMGRMPYYPIDLMVEAFEEDRKNELKRQNAKADKVAIIACGFNSWIAMRYATKYPKNVAGLIFIEPSSSEAKLRECSEGVQKKGKAENNTELFHYGLQLFYDPQNDIDLHDKWHRDNNVQPPEGEAEALHRMAFTTRFADQQDSLLEELYPIHSHPLGGCLVPDFKVFSEEAVEVPVLVIEGKMSIHASQGDVDGVAHHYKGEVVTFENSAEFPFAEEPEKFFKFVSGFLVSNFGKKK